MIEVPRDRRALPTVLSGYAHLNELSLMKFERNSRGHPLSARADCLSEAVTRLRQSAPMLKLTLVLVDVFWRPDNVITRHRGLWKQLRHEGRRLPISEASVSFHVRGDGGLKYWGFCGLEEEFLGEANAALVSRIGSIMMVHREADLANTLSAVGSKLLNGESEESFNWSCLDHVSEFGGYFVYPMGGFDDPSVFVYVASRPSDVSGGI